MSECGAHPCRRFELTAVGSALKRLNAYEAVEAMIMMARVFFEKCKPRYRIHSYHIIGSGSTAEYRLRERYVQEKSLNLVYKCTTPGFGFGFIDLIGFEVSTQLAWRSSGPTSPPRIDVADDDSWSPPTMVPAASCCSSNSLMRRITENMSASSLISPL